MDRAWGSDNFRDELFRYRGIIIFFVVSAVYEKSWPKPRVIISIAHFFQEQLLLYAYPLLRMLLLRY